MKRVLLTGCTTKLGECVAIALAKKGFSLVLHYFSEENQADALKKKCDAYQESRLLQGDFSTQKGVELFLREYDPYLKESYGYIHLFGPTLDKEMFHTTSENWQYLFQTNLLSFVEIMRGLQGVLTLQKGRVITMGMPFLEKHRGLTKVSAYFAIKSALLSYTLSLAKELMNHVTVNMISPSFLPNNTIFSRGESVAEEEVVLWVLSLFDEKASAVTGQNIEITKGFGL